MAATRMTLDEVRARLSDILDRLRPDWRSAPGGGLIWPESEPPEARVDLLLEILRAAAAKAWIAPGPPNLSQLHRWARQISTFEELARLLSRLARAHIDAQFQANYREVGHEMRSELGERIAGRRISEHRSPAVPEAALHPLDLPRSASRALCVDIHYVTDRVPSSDPRLGTKFTARRGRGLTYGECTVSLPPDRAIGQLPRPSWWRFEFTPQADRHAMLTKVGRLDEAGFYDRLGQRLASSGRREALVFVHGFNVSFESAALRTAQLAVDLKFQGAPVLYSWPAQGRVLDYVRDANNVDSSASSFLSFLSELSARSGAQAVHVIAHSMGNRALCQALHLLSQRGPAAAQARIGHVVLAAPDMDAEKLRMIGAEIRQTAGSMTLYASSRDLALRLSKLVNGGVRAGEAVMVLKDIESIDASTVDTGFLAHGYFSEERTLLADLYELLDGKPASLRFNLEEAGGPPSDHFRFRV